MDPDSGNHSHPRSHHAPFHPLSHITSYSLDTQQHRLRLPCFEKIYANVTKKYRFFYYWLSTLLKHYFAICAYFLKRQLWVVLNALSYLVQSTDMPQSISTFWWDLCNSSGALQEMMAGGVRMHVCMHFCWILWRTQLQSGTGFVYSEF